MDTSFSPRAAPVKTLFAVVVASLFVACPAFALSPGDSFRQSPCPPDQAAVAPPGMVLVPGGAATVGLDEQEIQERGVEVLSFLKTLAASVPRHEVQLEPYFIDRNEVTNQQWRIYLDLNNLEPNKDLVQYYWTDGKIPAGHENMPVVFVSYLEAEGFARWAWKRLPTEEEWEFAARGAEAFLWPWGNEFVGDNAWCADTKPFVKHAQAVGGKPEGKSPFGVFDLAGNVWEWTASSFDAYPKYADIQIKTKYSRGKPDKVSAAEFFRSSKRVIRGGAFDCKDVALLSAVRQSADPNTWYNTLGFRCACSARPGVDAVRRAVAQAGPQHFNDYPIDYASVLSLEVTHHDDQGLVTGNKGIAFAAVKDWKSLTDMQKLSRRGPVAAGVLMTTENMIEPTIVAGAYVVAYKAAEPKANGNGNGAAAKLFPLEGWTYPGWESHDPTLEARTAEAARKKAVADKKAARDAKRAAKKKDGEAAEGKDEEQPAEEGEAEGEAKAEEPEAEPEVKWAANPGSVEWDHTRDHVLLIDRSGEVVAAFAIEPPQEAGRAGEAKLARQKMNEDRRCGFPATEKYEFAFSVPLTASKWVDFTLPIRFAPDIFAESKEKEAAQKPAAPTSAEAEEKDSR